MNKLERTELGNDINSYHFNKPFETFTNGSTFGLRISFERNMNGISGILINYHFMCAILVLIASINFLIDPYVVPGRAGLLVTLFLVLTNFFSATQVLCLKASIKKPSLIINVFLKNRMKYQASMH